MGSFATKSQDYGVPFTQLFINTGGASGTEVEYAMEADPGTLSSAAKWRIKKIAYDGGTNNVASVKWASGNMNFDKVADNYANYVYS